MNYPVNDNGKPVIPWEDLDLTRAGNGNTAIKCPACIDDRKKKGVKSFQVHVGKGYGQCHHCGAVSYDKERKKSDQPVTYKKEYKLPDTSHHSDVSPQVLEWFKGRKIHDATLNTWGVSTATMWMPQTQEKENCIAFPYYDGATVVNNKYRDGAKNFRMEKDAKQILYGLNTLVGAENAIFVEGEIDALSFYEAGFKHVVSTPNGAPSLTDQEKENYAQSGSFGGDRAINLEYLDNCIDKIAHIKTWYIAVDNDLPGRRLAQELIRRFGAERVKMVEWGDFKDANECLCNENGGVMALQDLIKNAKDVPLESIATADDVRDSLHDILANGYQKGLSIGSRSFDDHFRFRTSELDMVVGGANQGKSWYLFWIMMVLAVKHGWKWAVYVPENSPPTEFYRTMIQMLTGKTFVRGRPDTLKKHELDIATEWISEHFFMINFEDEETEVTFEVLLEKFRELVFRKGIKGCLIDPINDLIAKKRPGENLEDYNLRQLGKMRKFKQRYDLKFILSMHPNSEADRAVEMDNDNRRRPKVLELADASGGSVFKNRVDNGISVYRNFWYDDTRLTTEVHIKKIKFQEAVGLPTKREYPITLNYDNDIKRFRVDGQDLIGGFFHDELVEPVINPPQAEMVFSSHQDRIDTFEQIDNEECPF